MLPDVFPDPIPFLEHLFQSLEKIEINVEQYELDHICYRVERIERYETLKLALKKCGTLLTESEIGGRPIASFKLDEAIKFRNRTIPVIELPAPKSGSFYPEGWEHVEFVIDQSFEDFMDRYPKLNFKTRGMSKSINPDISIKLDGATVKFHHNTLEYVIRYLD